MSIIEYTDAFRQAVQPTEEEVWAFRSTLQAMGNEFTTIANGIIPTIKDMTERHGPLVHITADLSHIRLDYDNWWKHILPERIQQDVLKEFGAQAADYDVTVLDCTEADSTLIVDLECAQGPVSQVYSLDDADMIDGYGPLRNTSGYKAMKSVLSRLGGIEMCVLLNARQAGVESSMADEKAHTPTVIISTRDEVPLIEKVRRFEEFGPVH